jgi:hypothetical protein
MLSFPSIYHPGFVGAFRGEGIERHGVLQFIDVAEELEFVLGALRGLPAIGNFYFHYIFSYTQ